MDEPIVSSIEAESQGTLQKRRGNLSISGHVDASRPIGAIAKS